MHFFFVSPFVHFLKGIPLRGWDIGQGRRGIRCLIEFDYKTLKTFLLFFLSPHIFLRMGKRKKSIVKLQKSYKEWVKRKDPENEPSTSARQRDGDPVSPSCDNIVLEPASTSGEGFVGEKCTLDKRMSLIREVVGAQDVQTSDKPNVVISTDQLRTAFQAALPLCGTCLARLDIAIDKTPSQTNIQVKEGAHH